MVKLLIRLSTRPQYHKRHGHLALQLVRYRHCGSLSNCGVLNQSRFQLIRTQSMTGHFDHFVGSSQDPEVTVIVPHCIVARIEVARVLGPVHVPVSIRVLVNCQGHSGPRILDDKISSVQ